MRQWAEDNGLCVLWDDDLGTWRWMCVECARWEPCEGPPWDDALVDMDGRAVTPRDAWDARMCAWAWFGPDGPTTEADPARVMWAESVLAVWPGDVCRECYRQWH